MNFYLDQELYFKHKSSRECLKARVIDITAPKSCRRPWALVQCQDDFSNTTLTYWKKTDQWSIGRTWFMITEEEYIQLQKPPSWLEKIIQWFK